MKKAGVTEKWVLLRRGNVPPVQKKPLNRRIGRLFNQIRYGIWNFLRRSVWGDYKAGGLRGLYHWVRCHTWNRYHIVNISGIDGYDWGWIDRDHVLLMASFKILQDFVEQENPEVGLRNLQENCAEWDLEWAVQADARNAEIRAIYTWWTEERPRDWKEYPSWEREQELNEKDEEMLIRLAKIRLCLWT